MISVIIPFFNAEKYLEDSIKCVLDQSFEDFEVILINDGSYDRSKEIAFSFHDRRVSYYEQKNRGVSSARNLGLQKMKGSHFCFLDADDTFPINSLASRIKIFEEDESVSFVDGAVRKMDSRLEVEKEVWFPQYFGNPLSDLVRLQGKSFMGLTWMIKREEGKPYKMNESITHGEDLLFFMELAKNGGKYSYTKEIILNYRDTPNSAMTNLVGLEKGYREIERVIAKWPEVKKKWLRFYKWHYKKAMFLAFLRRNEFSSAFKALK